MTITNDNSLNNLLKQAQQVQAKMQETQEQLARTTVTGMAGGGLVKVIMDGRHGVKSMEVHDSLLKGSKEVMEHLIAGAFNDATRKIEDVSRQKLGELTAGIQLPGSLE